MTTCAGCGKQFDPNQSWGVFTIYPAGSVQPNPQPLCSSCYGSVQQFIMTLKK
jgi:hypothetical protein